MDKRHYKILRKIKKSKKYFHTEQSDEIKSIVYYLSKRGFIIFCSDNAFGTDAYCMISESGKAELYKFKTDQRRWFIPILISIFAAIGGYREELLLLLRAAAKLWKAILAG